MSAAQRFVAKIHVRAAALEAFAAGLCVLPPREDGTKAPVGVWAVRQKVLSTLAELDRWYGHRTGLGIVTGSVSGGVTCLEFDDRAAYDSFKSSSPPEVAAIVERLEAGYLESTPGGGVHWLYRCSLVFGNTKLASRPKTEAEKRHPKDNLKTLIETRGEGGYLVIAPSHGRVHGTGRPYVLERGSLSTIPELSPDEQRTLWDHARTFDRTPKKAPRTPEPARGPRQRVSEEFDLRASWSDVLTPHGWTAIFEKGGTTHWQRPGKGVGNVPPGTSATTNHGGSDRLFVFTSSTEFEQNESYSKFAAHVVLNYGSDWSAASRAAREHTATPCTPPPACRDPEPAPRPLDLSLERRLVVVKRPAGTVPVSLSRARLALLEEARATLEPVVTPGGFVTKRVLGRDVTVYVEGSTEPHPFAAPLTTLLHCNRPGVIGECDTHGGESSLLFACKNHSCLWCAPRRVPERIRLMREFWPEGNYVVLETELPDSVEPQDHAKALRSLRRRFQGCYPKKTGVWFAGFKGVLHVTHALEKNGVEYRANQINTEVERRHGVVPEKARVVTKAEALALVEEHLLSPAVAFAELLEAVERGDATPADLARFPWLEGRIFQAGGSRTRRNDVGPRSLFWPSDELLAEQGKRRALEKRGGVPFEKCAEGHETGKPCMLDLTLHGTYDGRLLVMRRGKPILQHEILAALATREFEQAWGAVEVVSHGASHARL